MSAQKKYRGGRPKLDPTKRRSIIVRVRLTAPEYDRLQTKARTLNLSVSRLLMMRGLDIPEPRTHPEINKAAYRKLCGATANLNQLTRLAHSGRINSQITREIRKIRGVLTAVMRLLLGRNFFGKGHRL